MPLVVRADSPVRSEIPLRADTPKSADVLPTADAPPCVPAADDAAAVMAALEIEVPIDLSTELRLATAATKPPSDVAGPPPLTASGEHRPFGEVDQLKADMRRRLVERLDLEGLGSITDERQLARRVRETAAEFLRKENPALAASERDEVVEQVVDEIAGLGPIEPLLRDRMVSDILVTGAKDIRVERGGRLSRANASFRDDTHLLTVIGRIVSRAGARLEELTPVVDVRLPDGSRVNAIVPPLVVDGPVLSIRRLVSDLDLDSLTTNGTLTRRMATLLAACVHARLNVLIAGATGSGKTTLLNALTSFVPTGERVVTIEDAVELRPRLEQLVRLETRDMDARDIVRNALRVRPHRVIIGDLRGVEALDLLQAMNSGHEGSMATIHASSPREALSRLEKMAMLAGTELTARAVREQIASTVDVVVQVARLSDGRRRVISIAEPADIEDDVITTKDVFSFHRSRVLGGRVLGRFVASGVRPRFTERLQAGGVTLPARLFDAVPADGEDPGQPSPRANDTVVTSLRDVGGSDERHARETRQLEATIRSLETSVQQERLAVQGARVCIEELRAQVVATRLELDVMQDELRAARYEADEQRELQAMLQHRSRSLAVAVTGFVEVLDDLINAGRESADEGVRDRAARLGDATGRLLSLFGITEIDAIGGLVDDRLHEVTRHVPSDLHPSGMVVAVVQRGYAYQGQPVRRAQVLAAK
jgi:pilus assembly protein CpaF